jgi:hypothetical protein
VPMIAVVMTNLLSVAPWIEAQWPEDWSAPATSAFPVGRH